MANEKYGIPEIIDLINTRMNNAAPGTAVFIELARIKDIICQNLTTRMNVDMNGLCSRDFIKEVNENRFNESFWKIGDAYSIRLTDRYADAILAEVIKDDYGIIRLRFVTGIRIPGYTSNGFGVDVWTWQENKLACVSKTRIDHTIEPGEELTDVTYKIFNEEWFEKEADDYINCESIVVSRTLVKVEFRGSTMIGFVDPRKIQDREFELHVGGTSITIFPTAEEMNSIKIYPLNPLKDGNNE